MTVQFFMFENLSLLFSMCNSWCLFTVLPSVVVTLIAVIVAYYISMSVPEAVQSMGDNAAENMEKLRSLSKTAFVVGYTGETGKALVKTLANTKVFSKVTLIGRRQVEYEEDMLKDFNVEQKVVDFDKLDESADVFQGHDVGFCCMGTTRGKAGVEGFKKVDRDYVLKTAELAKSGGTTHFHLVSSQGADANSSLLYPQVKGQVEDTVKEMGFEKLSIYRPGLLMCDRKESRAGEWVLRKMLAPVEYAAPGLATTPTSTLAKAMIHATAAPQPEPFLLYNGKAIHRASVSKKK
ncbi:oxidoreductase HTATIP2-like [Amphiura filiformis]|uniref:oxidoreductase HTATIP2-like n=1 Tax=Amphiura filiformis TaxID=82378 RepID=UPI003B22029F